MTYYLANFDIRDGDNEYQFQFLVHAENLADAEEKGIDGLCYNYGVDRCAWDEKEELDLFSRIIRKGNQPQAIPDNEAVVLKKYFLGGNRFYGKTKRISVVVSCQSSNLIGAQKRNATELKTHG